MSIELLKQLEDLKQIQSSLSPQLNQQIDSKIKLSATNALSDFERFFKEKDFKTQTGKFTISASYGNLVAELKHSDPSTSYMGTYLRFDLSLKLPNKTDYLIALNPKGRTSGFSVSYSTANPNDQTKQIQAEIDRVKEDIEKAKKRIDNFHNEEWAFFLINEGPPRSQKEFNSIYDLLNSLVK